MVESFKLMVIRLIEEQELLSFEPQQGASLSQIMILQGKRGVYLFYLGRFDWLLGRQPGSNGGKARELLRSLVINGHIARARDA